MRISVSFLPPLAVLGPESSRHLDPGFDSFCLTFARLLHFMRTFANFPIVLLFFFDLTSFAILHITLIFCHCFRVWNSILLSAIKEQLKNRLNKVLWFVSVVTYSVRTADVRQKKRGTKERFYSVESKHPALSLRVFLK